MNWKDWLMVGVGLGGASFVGAGVVYAIEDYIAAVRAGRVRFRTARRARAPKLR